MKLSSTIISFRESNIVSEVFLTKTVDLAFLRKNYEEENTLGALSIFYKVIMNSNIPKMNCIGLSGEKKENSVGATPL